MGLWWLWTLALPAAPMPVRFAVAFVLFVAGPGGALAAILGARETLDRAAITLAGGLLLAAALAQALGEIGALRLFPYVATGLGGAALASGALRRTVKPDASSRRSWVE